MKRIDELKLELQYAITKGCWAEFNDEDSLLLLTHIIELEKYKLASEDTFEQGYQSGRESTLLEPHILSHQGNDYGDEK
jgi:hypothetical protein